MQNAIQFVGPTLMKRKRNSDFNSVRKPPASVEWVNPNEYQLICIGDFSANLQNKKEKKYNTIQYRNI